ncbi:MAG TPA: adenylate/guanylate cyclase domain-containing protein [Stellaceae bacterium]|jgi:adenylate cyclase
MPAIRRLAAILYADIAGYSRLMGADEEGTLRRLKSLHAELIEPTLGRHHGRIVHAAGDALLAEFQSVVDAMHGAIELRDGIAERAEPGADPIRYRIGVNLGDVIVDDDDIHGDGVNIAARLQALAEPGGICISRAVLTQTRGKLDFPVADLGDQELKNIDHPVHVFRVLAEEPPTARPAALPLPAKPSIAVLPFQNMSGDPEQEYFADGMVEEIITALSQIRWLFVIARNSTFSYKGKSPDAKEVARELGVGYVLEGSVRKVGDRVRITGQLINALNGAHLWAGRFDGTLDDIFDLQDRVALSVAGVIEPELHAAETRRSATRPATNLTAYDHLLRALSVFWSLTEDGIREAVDLLDRALACDPHYGPALSWAAICQMRLVREGWAEDPEAAGRKAVDLARRALRVAEDDPGILVNVAFVLANFGEDIGAMIGLVDRALSLTPSFARGWFVSSVLRGWAGQHDLAIEHAETSMRLSPRERRGTTLSRIAESYFFKHEYEEAVARLLLSIQDHPGYPHSYRILAACYAHMGQLDAAREIVAKLNTITAQIIPSGAQLRRPADRDLFLTGLRLAAGEAP